jgi:hypothetical protein
MEVLALTGCKWRDCACRRVVSYYRYAGVFGSDLAKGPMGGADPFQRKSQIPAGQRHSKGGFVKRSHPFNLAYLRIPVYF